jgi:hypothetical protein
MPHDRYMLWFQRNKQRPIRPYVVVNTTIRGIPIWIQAAKKSDVQ